MRAIYEFTTETVVIEVNEKWGNILKEMDRIEYNNNHAETRRHTSYDTDSEAGEWLADKNSDPALIYEENVEVERINKAFKTLTEDQKKLIWDLWVKEMTVKNAATLRKIDHTSITHRVKRIQKKIKKVLK